MPLRYYPGMDDRNLANRLHAISPSVPPAHHEMPVPPPSPNKSKMLPPPTPPNKGKEKEKNESNVGGLLMDLAKDGSEDGTSTPTEKYAGTAPPVPSEQDAATIPPAPTGKDAATIAPPPTGKEAGTTPQRPTNPMQKGTPNTDQYATPGSKNSSSDNDNTEVDQYVSCFPEWLGLDPDCKRMLDDEIKMLAHHGRNMGNKAIHIFQQAVNSDPELFVETQAQVTAALYAMREAMVRFNTRLGNISFFASCQGKRKADTEGGRRQQVRKE